MSEAFLLAMLVERNDKIQRALQILQQAQRYGLEPVGNYQGEAMMSNDYGDWLDFDDVAKAIQILQGEGKE